MNSELEQKFKVGLVTYKIEHLACKFIELKFR